MPLTIRLGDFFIEINAKGWYIDRQRRNAMGKIRQHFSKNYKKYLCGSIITVCVTAGFVGLYWDKIRLYQYCRNPELCACLEKKLTHRDLDTFVALERYAHQTGQAQPDAKILRQVSVEDIQEVRLKTRTCLADIARQKMLDNAELNRFGFSGDYWCMRGSLMNTLSNDEILFLESPQSQDANLLRTNPQIREMYLQTSPKLMRCMSLDVQRQYLAEIQALQTALNPPAGQGKASVQPAQEKQETKQSPKKPVKKKK